MSSAPVIDGQWNHESLPFSVLCLSLPFPIIHSIVWCDFILIFLSGFIQPIPPPLLALHAPRIYGINWMCLCVCNGVVCDEDRMTRFSVSHFLTFLSFAFQKAFFECLCTGTTWHGSRRMRWFIEIWFRILCAIAWEPWPLRYIIIHRWNLHTETNENNTNDDVMVIYLFNLLAAHKLLNNSECVSDGHCTYINVRYWLPFGGYGDICRSVIVLIGNWDGCAWRCGCLLQLIVLHNDVIHCLPPQTTFRSNLPMKNTRRAQSMMEKFYSIFSISFLQNLVWFFLNRGNA